jgi:hypothetical protein
LRYDRASANDLLRRRRSSTRPVRLPRHGTWTGVRRNLHGRRVLAGMDDRVVLLKTLRGMRNKCCGGCDGRRTRRKGVGKMRNEVKATNATHFISPFPRPPMFVPVCPWWRKKIRHLNNFKKIFFSDTCHIMFARLLVRWPHSSPVALHAHARAFRATSLARTPSAATVLKPRLAPATSAYEPQVDQSTNRAHFSSTRFADAPISTRSKTAIPHEYALLHPSLFGR